MVPFPPILTILQRLQLNPGCQEKLGKSQRGFGPSEWPQTLLTWGWGLKAWGSGIQVGRSCRDGGASSDKPATKALPGLKSPMSGLKVPLSWAGGLLTGSPGANHCSGPLVAVLVLKLQPMLPMGCIGSPGEKTQTAEGAGSLVLHCLMLEPRPSPQYRLPGGELAGARLLKLSYSSWPDERLSCRSRHQTSQADFSRSSRFLSGLDYLGGGPRWTRPLELPIQI